ncbi:MAG: hypothetical protein FJ303_04335 [Planctomycetes bacterium]|nr:hypothetical protein [Planctomycetota bacterium]
MKKQTSGQFLERLLEPVSALLDDDAGRKLVELKADRQAQSRIAKLADKCNRGVLSDEERRDYETYVMVGEFIAILQAQARARLVQRGQAK